jgi:hypothetical protein
VQALREGRRLRDEGERTLMGQTIPTRIRLQACEPCGLSTPGTRLGKWSSFVVVICPVCRGKHTKGLMIELDASTTDRSRGQAVRGWKRNGARGKVA